MPVSVTEVKKEAVGNRVRRTGGSMFISKQTIKVEFPKNSPWKDFKSEFIVERGLIWRTVGLNRKERRS